jgi:hypothetical protein
MLQFLDIDIKMLKKKISWKDIFIEN